MQKIVPCVWFDGTAEEAANFYATAFPGGRVVSMQRYPTEGLLDFQAAMAGKPLVVDFELGGYRLTAINAGPEFPVNPSVSFMVNFDPAADPAARERLDAVWAALSEGGTALMPLQEYAFSPHYGWIQDRYGVSWQLRLAVPGAQRPFIVPCLMFGHTAQGRAAEALEFYAAALGGTQGTVALRPEGDDAAGQVLFADFTAFGQWFAAMDAPGQDFTFTPGVSLILQCAGQEEIDRLWGILSSVPEAEQCGWCADRFGLSWQIVPDNLGELMASPGAYPALMSMKKIEIAAFG